MEVFEEVLEDKFNEQYTNIINSVEFKYLNSVQDIYL